MSTPKILFINHSSARTGAPIALLRLVEWLSRNTSMRCDVFLRHDGELAEDFERLGCKIYKSYGFLHRCFRFLVYLRVSRERYSAIVANTAVNGRILSRLLLGSTPVVTYVHELEYILQLFAQETQLTKKYTSLYMCVSEAVRENLIERHGVPRDKTVVVHNAGGFDVLPEERSDEAKTLLSRSVFQELGIAPGSYVVLGCGTFDWRKGSDLFLLVALELLKRSGGAPLYFLWLGDGGADREVGQRQYELERLGVGDKIRFIGGRKDPRPFFAAAHLLLMTSREDPCPLVMSEAGLMGCPTVCFQKSGGAEEFVSGGAGVAVPFLDVSAMAAAVRELVDDPDRRAALGQRAIEVAEERHTLERCGEKIRDVLLKLVNSSKPAS